ncbi:MAG: GGDEF domain-containing protein [Sorangiineae bacterium PRO1]|nr:GGDEF domain-containing protein [Sorangiineae bacterium PRO1]
MPRARRRRALVPRGRAEHGELPGQPGLAVARAQAPASERAATGRVALAAASCVRRYQRRHPRPRPWRTVDPEGFAERARQLAADPTSERTDLIELRDGRSIERSIRPQWLGGEVIGRVWSYRDVTHARRVEAALRASEEQLRELASRDALTGLFNRRHVQARLGEEVARSLRTGRGFSLAMLDIDHFKRVNDEHGHQTGDDVLRAFADDLTSRVRKTDCVGRWGGEEFLLILPETSKSAAHALLQALREHVARERGGLPRFTISVGIAELPGDANEAVTLVAAADARLYEAKRAGRNCVR